MSSQDIVSLGLAHEVEVALRKIGATRENFWVPLSEDDDLAKRVVELVASDVRQKEWDHAYRHAVADHQQVMSELDEMISEDRLSLPLHIAPLPRSTRLNLGEGKSLRCTVFRNNANAMCLSFRSDAKELANRSVRFIDRDGETGEPIFTKSVLLKLEEGDVIASGTSELAIFEGHHTIEFELE